MECETVHFASCNKLPVLLSDFNNDDKNEVKIILPLIMQHKKCNITQMSAFSPHLLPLTSLFTSSTLCKHDRIAVRKYVNVLVHISSLKK